MRSKLRTSLLVSFLLYAFLILASEEAIGQDWARKMFSEFEHDFGTVSKNEFAEHRFKITNLYNETLTIQSVKTSCTCTDVSLTRNSISTDEVAEVVAVFNTRNFVGPKQATITVTFAAPFNAEVQMTVRGNIRGDVMFEPGSIDFGSVSADAIAQRSATKQIQITKFNNPSWRIVDVKCTFPHIGVVLSNPTRIGNQVKYTMDVRLKESAPAGFVQEQLMVIAQVNGRQTAIPVKFAGKVGAALEISPEVLTFAVDEKGSEVSKKVIVKGSKAFKISDVTCSSPAFVVKADPTKSKKIHFVQISYKPDQSPGKYEYDLEFVTDLNNQTKRTIKAVVQVKQPADPVNDQVGQ